MPDPAQVDDKSLWGKLSVKIAEMEDYFVSLMEELPPTGALPVESVSAYSRDRSGTLSWDRSGSLVSVIAMNAVLGLMGTASCRHKIGAGRTADAALEMHYVTELCQEIRRRLQDDEEYPALKEGFARLSTRKTGQETSRKNERREIENRLSDIKEWRREGLTDERCIARGMKEWVSRRKKKGGNGKVGRETAKRMIRKANARRDQGATPSPSDS
jgi:hypothetical protein